ncbi:APC family permease [Hamadaea sp. NPDC051192]|uniref:APC family permease n=1 Tax=Hamadaea sp. NPDC051192 TaxID=3154940 RepID=UPI00342D4A88
MTGVAQFVLTSAAPLLVVAGIVTTGWAVTGVVAVPLAFLLLAVLLGLFSIGYMAMARRVVNAGALYTYATWGLGKPAGVAAGLLAVLSYNTMQVGAYGMAGAVATGLLEQHAGITVAWWKCALVAWLLVAVMGSLRVDLNGKVLAVLLAGEVLFVAAAAIAGLTHPAAGHVSVAALNPAHLATAGAGAVLAIAWTGYVGFEQAPVYSEESRNPRRTVPLATFGALTLMAVVYAVVSWSVSVAVGPEQIVPAAQQQSIELLFTVAAPLGDTVVLIGHLLFLTSLLAGLIAFHNTTARYGYALGRSGVLPRVLARTSLRSGSPIAASLAQSACGLAVILLYTIMGWDPLVQMMFYLATIGGVGILLLVTITSLAVLVFFLRHRGASLLATIVAPALATVGLLAVSGLCLAHYDTLLGVDPHSPLRWIFPILYGVVLLGGLIWGLMMRALGMPAYALIGNGATVAPATIAVQPALGGAR